MTAKRIRYALTGVFYACVLAAFAYGSTGCTSTPKKDPCPPGTEERLQSLLTLSRCKGKGCEVLLEMCFVAPMPSSMPTAIPPPKS